VRPVKALRRFTVRAHLPERLSALEDLATNLRWSWHTPTLDLFESIDPHAWAGCDNDPVRMLGEVSAARFDELANDDDFLARLGADIADLRDYLTRPRWFQRHAEAG